jgi:peptidoglycan hydrolase-like protein with peptidoglycan-binding domain
VGAVISRGKTLFKVNNLPIALMYGSVPAYRTLEEGVSDGPDVGELNANLVALGFDPYRAISVDDHFSEATAAAVKRWQHAEGLSETGEVELGRIVFAPGARRVTAVHVVLGQDPPGGESEEASKPSSSSKASSSSSPSKPESSEKEGAGEKEKEGASGGAPVLVLTTTGDAQVVTLSLKATQQELAHVGEAVPVQLPDGTTVHGHVSEVGTVASESSSEGSGGNGKGGNGNEGGNGENATISVKVTLDHPVAHLDKAPVSVELVKAIRRHVLAVPATALVATGGGGFAVQVLEGNRRVEIPVTPGMFANGYVQVEGSGLSEGMTVLQPS